MIKLRDFPVSTGRICLMSCISDIFNFYRLSVNESVVFTVSEASLFYYRHYDIHHEFAKNEPVKLFSLKMGGMRYDIPLMIDNILDYFDMDISKQSGYEMVEVKEFIKKHIDLKLPVLSLLSRRHLEYMDKSFRDNITHSTNLTGYDWDNNVLYVNDTFIPTVPVKYYCGYLSFDNYYDSLTCSKDIFNKDFTFRNLVFVPQNSRPFTDYPITYKLEPLKRVANNFLSAESLDKDIKTGLKAYNEFLEDYKSWMKESATPEMLNLMKIIHHRLTNFGGPMITNQLLAEYIECLINTDNNLKYQLLKNKFIDLSKKWFIIANIFCKASLGKMEEVKLNLYNRLVDIVSEEESIYTEIMQQN